MLGQRVNVPESVRGQNHCVASIRPEKVFVNGTLTGAGWQFDGVLRQTSFTGRELQLVVDVPGHGLMEALTAPAESMVALKPGEAVRLGFLAADTLYFSDGELGKLLS